MSVVVSVLILIGAFFSMVASLGILRMPDLLMRMHAATKAGTLGAGLVLLAAALSLFNYGAALRAGSAIVFLLLTAPVAAHLIGRAAYHSGRLRLWERTGVDELRDAHTTPTMEDPVPDAAGLGSRDVPVAGAVAGGTTLHLGTRSDAC